MANLLPKSSCFHGPNAANYGAIQNIMMGLISTIIEKSCELDHTNEYPRDIGLDLLPQYDFIVIGAGSSGSVIANRLSEVSEWKVLLIEAGDDPSVASDLPMLSMNTVGTNADWQFAYQPDRQAFKGLKKRVCYIARGKVLGGTSTINGMIYARPNRLDFDEWAEMGFQSWNYKNVLKYFKRSENFTFENDYHSTDGLLNVEALTNPSHVSQKLLIAAQQMGSTISDTNGESQVGYDLIASTVNHGIRESTAKAFLVPITNRENIHVMKRGLVTKLLFDAENNRITGVKILKDGITISATTKKEVILSAGVIGSPQLLMVSGFGPKETLAKAGITVLKDIPEIGQNWRDQPKCFGFVFALTKFETKDVPREKFFDFLMTRNNSLPDSLQVLAYINTANNANKDRPDIQLVHVGMSRNSLGLGGLLSSMNVNDDIANELKIKNQFHPLLMIFTSVIRPKSKGRLEIVSGNLQDKPIIHGKFLSDESDLQTLLAAVSHIVALGQTESMQSLGAELVDTVPRCNTGDVSGVLGGRSLSYWECVIRHTTTSSHHLSGTCAMGPVVGEDLRVIRVSGLRVADASIMPTVISGHHNAACIMIGEKVSEDIKNHWLK